MSPNLVARNGSELAARRRGSIIEKILGNRISSNSQQYLIRFKAFSQSGMDDEDCNCPEAIGLYHSKDQEEPLENMQLRRELSTNDANQ